MALEIVKAEGSVLVDVNRKEYIDLIGGISVATMGHRHPKVVEAIRKQLDAYLHIMVYGEFVETPQVQYAKWLAEHLPLSLNSVYFTNSGAEATEGAMKLAKRFTGRTGIIAFRQAYHGSTQGALSIMGSEYWRNAFRPLLPGIQHFDFNSFDAIEEINDEMACVVLETVQGEAGVIAAQSEWLQALRKKCTDTGTLLILDEVQCGFGRTGSLWAFEQFSIIPDILLLGKGLGGGMPLGAFIAPREIMTTLTNNPALGHITTFGGHPVSCAAGLAAAEALLSEGVMNEVRNKEALFKSLLHHKNIRSVRSCGLWLSIEFDSFDTNKIVIDHCVSKGVLTDWFLFAPNCLRISPPLNISDLQIRNASAVLLNSMDLA